MSSISTFGAFTTARLGIYVSQKALDVVGNNIANVNTVGYTRQSHDQKSMYAGAADRYRTKLDARVGNGAIITSITQLRDPYLDIRYRNEQSSVGAMEAKLNGLGQLADILDEVGKGEEGEGVLEAQFSDLISQIQKHNTLGAGLDTYDTLVRKSASSLVDKFHSYAAQLDTLLKNQRINLDQDIENVNRILSNIRDLNSTIRKSNIYGGDALEQRDERNNLIDELSEYVRVDVTYELEDIGEGQMVEKLVIKLAGNSGKDGREINNATLVDGIYARQLSILQQEKKDENGDPIPATDADGNELEDEDGNPVYEMEDDPYLRLQLSPLVDRHDRKQAKVTVSTLEAEQAANEYIADHPGMNLELKTVLGSGGNVIRYDVVRTIETKDPRLKDPEVWSSTDEQKAKDKCKELNDKKAWGHAYAVSEPDLNTGEYTIKETYPQVSDVYRFPDAAAYTEKRPVFEELAKTDTTKKYRFVSDPVTPEYSITEYTQKNRSYFEPPEWTEAEKDAKAYMDDPDTDTEDMYEFVEHVSANGDKTYEIYKKVNREYTVESFEVVEDTVTLGDNTLYGAIQSERELLTEQGEYATSDQLKMDVNASNKRGIKYYQKSLDTLANIFANMMNEANVVKGGTIHTYPYPADVKDQEIYYNDAFQTDDGSLVRLKTEKRADGKLYFKVPEGHTIPDTVDLKVPEDDPMTEDQIEYLLPLCGARNPDGSPIDDVDLTQGQGVYDPLPKDYKEPDDGPLFSNDGDGDSPRGITAANISISKNWADGKVRIQQSLDPFHPSTDNTNISHILNIMQNRHDFNPDGRDLKTGSHLEDVDTALEDADPTPGDDDAAPGDDDTASVDNVFFNGTFQEFYTENMVGTLSTDYMDTNERLDNYLTSADELYVERDSVSGVDLNDEAMSMIQYQKSYSAACRLMTAVDEMLDKLINGTGRAGL